MKIKLLPLVLMTLTQGVLAQQLPGAGTQLQQLPPPPEQQAVEPSIRIEEATAPLAPGDESTRVPIDALQFDGAKAFSPSELAAVAQFKPGSALTLSQMQAMADRVTEYYHRHGYFVARAFLPAQDVTGHALTIAISEGQYGEITLHNHSRLSDSVANRALSGLRSGDAIKIAPLEDRLLLLSDVPGVRVTSTLVPGAAPGSSDLVVDVAPGRLVTGSIDVDNAGNPYTGEDRIGATINLNDPFGRGDIASLRLLTSGPGLKYGRASYQMPFGRAAIGVSYSRLDYALGRNFKVLKAHGTADVASVFGTVNLIRSRNSNLYAGLAYEDRRFEDDVDVFHSVTDKKAHVAIASLYGNHRDTIGGGGMDSFYLAVSMGSLDIQTPLVRVIDGLTARTNGSYGKVLFNASRLQHVTDRFSLRGSFTGQYATKNLDQSEKMVLGGMDGVRGYPQGEAFGDQGYIVDLEASLLLAGLSAHVPGDVHVLGFVEDGQVTINKNPWYPGDNTRNLSSAGVGLSWGDPGNFLVRTYYARKLGSEKATSVTSDTSGHFWIQAIKYF